MINLFPKKLESYSSRIPSTVAKIDMEEYSKLEAKPGEAVIRFYYNNEKDVFKAINSLPKTPKSLLFTRFVENSGFPNFIVTQRIDVKNKKNYELITTKIGDFISEKEDPNSVDYYSGISPKSVIKKIIKSKVHLKNATFNPNNSQIKSFEVLI